MAKKVKKPVTKGVAKVPQVMQLEALECGAACLTMILAYYNKWVPLEQVRADCDVSRDGSNARNILKAAEYYGLETGGYKLEPEDLRKEGEFPCIIHWNFNHFVVLDGFKGDKAYLNDPARGQYTVSMEDFDEAFTGICLMFEPTADFVPSGKPKSIFEFARKRLVGTGVAVAFTIICGFITSIMTTINPVFSRVFMDRLLTHTDENWVKGFFWMLIIFSLIQITMSALQAIYSLRIEGKMSAVGNSTYFWKVLNMPMQFFSQRMAGDIQSRQFANASVASTLIHTFTPLAMDGIMMIVYLAIMLNYSVLFTMVGIGSMFLIMFISRYISKKRINITRVSMREEAKLSSMTIAGVDMIETIKASGAENGFFEKWGGSQAAANNQQMKVAKLNQTLGKIPEFIYSMVDLTILIMGALLIMKGEFTVGMVLAFQSFLGMFMTPAQELISAGQTMQEMRTMMERVEDVMEYPEDRVFEMEEGKGVYDKLSGKVDIDHLYFGYSRLGDKVIKDFNLHLEPGKSVAIVGPSGCGKSTMSKLIAGLYQPQEGEIRFDGYLMSEINKNAFYSSLSVVDQDIILFEDTIENNIKMWDDTIRDIDMTTAARDALIHEDIVKRKGAYQSTLLERGRDLSGGQKQRIEIARVLARNPSIVILDEATSALDAKTEYDIVEAIKRREASCIVIAHRLSTIRYCDEIIVMKKGEIVDRGTHKELMEKSETYRKLVTTE